MGRPTVHVHPTCHQCNRNCALFHGKGESSSISPSSFVKVMVGDDFSRVLYFPPKFSSTVSAFVNEEISLKDSNGKKWTTTVTTVDNYYALEKGWNAFASDHGLEIGDFLVFSYVHKYFDVIIYGKSCVERLDFSKRRNNKRKRDRSGSLVRDGPMVRRGPDGSVIPEPDVPKMNVQNREVDVGGTQNSILNILKSDKNSGRAQPMGIRENCEDLCHVTSQDYCGGNDETWKISTGYSKFSHVGYASRVHQNDATRNKYPLFEGILGNGAASDASKVDLFGKGLGVTDRSAYEKISTSKLVENRRNNFILSNREDQERESAMDLGETSNAMKNKHVGRNPNGSTSKDELCTKVETSITTKKVHVGRNPNESSCSLKEKFSAKVEMSNTMKKEPVGRNPNRSSLGELSAKGETSNMMKEHVGRNPNGGSSLIDKLLLKGEMSNTMKKEHVGKNPKGSSSKDELSAEGKMLTRIKEEIVDMTPKMPSSKHELGETGLAKFIKQEPGHNIQSVAAVSCVVPSDNDDFLALPTSLPCSHRGRVTMDRMVVLLRDQQKQQWPVLYHEQPCLKILTAGWSQFCRANNIQPADVCTFGIEDEARRIYNVNIVRNR